MVYDYNTHYKLRPIVAPWQLNRVWAGVHCLLSTRITQLRWMASYTRTHSCMWGCLGCGVQTGLCTQSLISIYDRLHTCTLAHTQTHTHTFNLTQTPGVSPCLSLEEWDHALHSFRVAHTAACQILACRETKRGNSIKFYTGFTFLLLCSLLFGTLKIVWQMQHMNFLTNLFATQVFRRAGSCCEIRVNGVICVYTAIKAELRKLREVQWEVHHSVAFITLPQGSLMISTDAYPHIHFKTNLLGFIFM